MSELGIGEEKDYHFLESDGFIAGDLIIGDDGIWFETKNDMFYYNNESFMNESGVSLLVGAEQREIMIKLIVDNLK